MKKQNELSAGVRSRLGYKLCKGCGQPMLKRGQKRKHPDDYRHAQGCPYDRDAPPQTLTLSDLPGLPGETQAVPVRSVTAATKWLRKDWPVTAAGTYGAINVWRVDGQWHAEFQRHFITVATLGCNHLASVVEWLKEWLPRLHSPAAEEESA